MNNDTPFSISDCRDEDVDGVMELLWQNGNVVVQKSSKRSPFPVGRQRINDAAAARAEELQRLFIQDNHETAAANWLNPQQHQIDQDFSFARDDSSYSDFFSSALPPPPPPSSITSAAEIPPPPSRRSENSDRSHNFVHFSAIAESNETPIAAAEDNSRTFANTESGTAAVGFTSSVSGGDLADGTCEFAVTSSSPGGSGDSYGERRNEKPAAEDRKRKGGDSVDEFDSEDVGFQAFEDKRQPKKRSRAAQVHKLSERRRRDRINEKMKSLQEMIPRCNKSDKASMLDDAIEYMKSLQLQMQMMSMGYGMVPMMYPGMQQYMPAMGLSMGMAMGMNRPMMPHPSLLSASTAQTGSIFPYPPVQNSINPNRQLLDLHQAQNQAAVQQLTTKPSSSDEAFGKRENNL